MNTYIGSLPAGGKIREREMASPNSLAYGDLIT
jgi:hypothetical protein